MKLCVPDFFEQFHCIADRCTDTCCVGWEIDIDEYTEAMYARVPGEFGKKLSTNIFESHFKLTSDERCPFLNKKNLCEIISNIGENSLCDICREHPRFVEYFGDYKEQGLGLCCEEAVRLLLSSDEPLHFKYSSCNEYPDELDENELYAIDEILGHRHNIFTLLTQREYPLKERIDRVLAYAKAIDMARYNIAVEDDSIFQNVFDTNSPETLNRLVEYLSKTESYGKEWDSALQKIKSCKTFRSAAQNCFTNEEIERITCYMIFRYYAKSFFDGQGLIKAKFAVAFVTVLQNFAHELANAQGPLTATDKINAIKLLSKQLEYSEGNMAMFEIMFAM